MPNVSAGINQIFSEASDFILLGLTGRTGSGCSTVAAILAQEELRLPEETKLYETKNDKLKYKIARKYVLKNWEHFHIIRVRNILTSFLLELTYEEFITLVSNELDLPVEDIKSRLESYKETYSSYHEKITAYKALPESNAEEKEVKKNKAWEIHIKELPSISGEIKDKLQQFNDSAYVRVYQRIGDNVRASGKADNSNYDAGKLFSLPKIINKIIKVIRYKHQSKKVYIVIDAIRNPYEAFFFNIRYANFFLMSINTPNEERLNWHAPLNLIHLL